MQAGSIQMAWNKDFFAQLETYEKFFAHLFSGDRSKITIVSRIFPCFATCRREIKLAFVEIYVEDANLKLVSWEEDP